jgi:methylenetetrahydrofolate reductase (NADPH)
VVDRLKKTPKERWQEEGMAICVEIIEQVRQIRGVKGVHVMAYRQEEMVAEIIRRSNLFPRVPPTAVRPSAAARQAGA